MSHYSVAQREKAAKGQSKTTVLSGGVHASQSLLLPLCEVRLRHGLDSQQGLSAGAGWQLAFSPLPSILTGPARKPEISPHLEGKRSWTSDTIQSLHHLLMPLRSVDLSYGFFSLQNRRIVSIPRSLIFLMKTYHGPWIFWIHIS